MDVKKQEIISSVRNLTYRKLLEVAEFSRYQGIPATPDTDGKFRDKAKVETFANVRISSKLGLGLVRERIELWSQSRFRENLVRSRMGMQFVMDKVREQGGRLKGFTVAMQNTLSQDSADCRI